MRVMHRTCAPMAHADLDWTSTGLSDDLSPSPLWDAHDHSGVVAQKNVQTSLLVVSALPDPYGSTAPPSSTLTSTAVDRFVLIEKKILRQRKFEGHILGLFGEKLLQLMS